MQEQSDTPVLRTRRPSLWAPRRPGRACLL